MCGRVATPRRELLRWDRRARPAGGGCPAARGANVDARQWVRKMAEKRRVWASQNRIKPTKKSMPPERFSVLSGSFFSKRDFLRPITHNRRRWFRLPTPMLSGCCQGPARRQQRLFIHVSMAFAKIKMSRRRCGPSGHSRPTLSRWAECPLWV